MQLQLKRQLQKKKQQLQKKMLNLILIKMKRVKQNQRDSCPMINLNALDGNLKMKWNQKKALFPKNN
jgi:hypothetical protein